MATDVTIDTRTDGGSTSSSATRAWNHTVTGGLTNSILIVEITNGSGTLHAATGVNWDQLGTPVALTFLGKINDANNNCYTELWYLKNPASGTKQIQVSYSTPVEITAGSSSYQFVNQTTPWNAASPNTNTGFSSPGSLTVTSATHEMAIGCFVENGGSALTNAGGQTVIHNDNIGAGNHAGTSSDAPGAATVAFSVTGITGGNAWAFVGGSLQFDGGGGAAAVTTSPAFRQPVPMRTGPNGFTRGTVWAQSTSNPPVPLAPIIAIDTPRPFQMNIPMRPTAGGFVIGTPMQQARGAPVSPPAPGSRRRIRLIN